MSRTGLAEPAWRMHITACMAFLVHNRRVTSNKFVVPPHVTEAAKMRHVRRNLQCSKPPRLVIALKTSWVTCGGRVWARVKPSRSTVNCMRVCERLTPSHNNYQGPLFITKEWAPRLDDMRLTLHVLLHYSSGTISRLFRDAEWVDGKCWARVTAVC